MEVGDLSKALKELVEENQRLKFTKEQHKDVVSKLQNMVETMQEIIKALNPVVSIKIVGRAKPGAMDNLLKELYGMMVNGDHVTRQKIEMLYPNLDGQKPQYVMGKLQVMPNVKKAKDGTKLRLFI
jgi:regulator of replication initiation timing